jgi:hypothetical protein
VFNQVVEHTVGRAAGVVNRLVEHWAWNENDQTKNDNEAG